MTVCFVELGGRCLSVFSWWELGRQGGGGGQGGWPSTTPQDVVGERRRELALAPRGPAPVPSVPVTATATASANHRHHHHHRHHLMCKKIPPVPVFLHHLHDLSTASAPRCILLFDFFLVQLRSPIPGSVRPCCVCVCVCCVCRTLFLSICLCAGTFFFSVQCNTRPSPRPLSAPT